MTHPRLQKQNCAVLSRCSTPGQADTSLANQAHTVESVVRDNNMRVVFEIQLAGVSGSYPGARTDIEQIVQRKELCDDFEILLVPSVDRFTRVGPGHGQSLLYQLESAGIYVYFCAEALFSDDPHAKLLLTYMFSAATSYVDSMARAENDGTTRSFLEGRSPHSRRPPFGLDRLYFVDTKPVHVLRNMPDGTQQLLNPRTQELIRTFGRNPRKGTPAHYLKQKNESVKLVPGEATAYATVCLIMKLRWLDNMSISAIARHLNRSNFSSSTGTSWSTHAVHHVACNPIYVGKSIRGRTATGRYYETSRDGARKAAIALKDIHSRKHAPKRYRPERDWLEVPAPHLENYLPEEIRHAARAGIEEYLARCAPGKKLTPNKNKHKHSRFILSGILCSTDGIRMQGIPSGKYRYYRIPYNPEKMNCRHVHVRADAIENAVAQVLAAAIEIPRIEEAMKKAAAARKSTAPGSLQTDSVLVRLRRQQKALVDRLTGDAELDAEFEAQLKQLDEQIALQMRSRQAVGKSPLPNREEVKRLAEQFRNAVAHLNEPGVDEKDLRLVRGLLRMVVVSARVDPTNKNVSLELALPTWCAWWSQPALGLVSNFAGRSGYETHAGLLLSIAKGVLVYQPDQKEYEWNSANCEAA